MDAEKRERLIARCGELEPYNGGGSPRIVPLVRIEEFFDGAEGEAGILCNVPAAPNDTEVLELLRTIRARPDVSDVRIAVTLCEDCCWPFSDTILVVTAADEEDVMSWFPKDMAPDECAAVVGDHFVHEPPSVPAGSRAIWLWFD